MAKYNLTFKLKVVTAYLNGKYERRRFHKASLIVKIIPYYYTIISCTNGLIMV